MANSIINEIKKNLDCVLCQNENANVGRSERILSITTGSFILLKGVTNIFSHPVISLGELVIGGFLLKRGVSGYCEMKAALDEDDKITPPPPAETTAY